MTPEQKAKLQAMKAKAAQVKAPAPEPEEQTSIEVGGVKFTGGKMFAVITALTTLVGALYGAFEVYKDYMDMKEQIQSYVAPDLSGFQEQISVLEERMFSLEESVEATRSYTRDIRDDLRGDIDRIESLVESTNSRTKDIQDEAFTAIRDMESQVREMIDIADDRFDNKRDALQLDTERKLEDLEERLTNTMQRVLNNPLSQ